MQVFRQEKRPGWQQPLLLGGTDEARGERVLEWLGLYEMLCWLAAPLFGLCLVFTHDFGRLFRNYFGRNDLIAIDAVF